MAEVLSVDDLLAGPRGRRVCLEIAFQVLEVWQVPWRCDDKPVPMAARLAEILGRQPLVAATLEQVAERAREADHPSLVTDEENPRRSDPSAPLSLDVSVESVSLALTASVDAARYWQAPDEWDVALALPVAREALRPVAELLVASEATAWWTARLDLDDLHEVEMLEEGATAQRAPLTGVGRRLSAWRAARDESEAHHVDADRGLGRLMGGAWWSVPHEATPVTTSSTVPSLGPAGLSYVEDGFGWSRARSWPMSARRPVRTYEVDGPEDLSRLVARFPLDVSRSRRGCWWETTGVDTAWCMVDWEAASHELDAVHLTVRGYLSTAGRAVPVPGRAILSTSTVLAGWTPGETVWLSDLLSPAGPPVRWVCRKNATLWAVVTDEWESGT